MRTSAWSLPRSLAAFSRTDLATLLASLVVLGGLTVPLFASARTQNQRVTCLNNVRRLMQSFQMYAADNRGYLPHPTWGSIPQGVRGWAYAPRSDGRFAELPAGTPIPDAFRKTYEVARLEQLPFLKMGQSWDYLREEEVYLCPQDVAEWTQEPQRTLFRQRSFKLTSYAANGSIIDNGNLPSPLPGATAPLSLFRGDDVLMWEKDEGVPFYFNDAGNQPSELTTARHSGGTHVGRVDGGAEYMAREEFLRLGGGPGSGPPLPYPPAPRPNRLWCFPR